MPDTFDQMEQELGEEGVFLRAIFNMLIKNATQIRELQISVGLSENDIECLEETVAKLAAAPVNVPKPIVGAIPVPSRHTTDV